MKSIKKTIKNAFHPLFSSGASAYFESSLGVRVLPASYWRPLALVSPNASLLVEEGTSIAIAGRSLQVNYFECGTF